MLFWRFKSRLLIFWSWTNAEENYDKSSSSILLKLWFKARDVRHGSLDSPDKIDEAPLSLTLLFSRFKLIDERFMSCDNAEEIA